MRKPDWTEETCLLLVDEH